MPINAITPKITPIVEKNDVVLSIPVRPSPEILYAKPQAVVTVALHPAVSVTCVSLNSFKARAEAPAISVIKANRITAPFRSASCTIFLNKIVPN